MNVARYGRAPEDIPANLVKAFTLNGTIPVKKYYFDQAYLGGNAKVSIWTRDMITDLMDKVKNRYKHFNYDTEPLYKLFDARPNLVSNKKGLVIGSEYPWLESLLLHYGASEIHTLEFGSIVSEDHRIKAFTPDSFKFSFLDGKILPYDFAFSYSSLEHDGLGRYGDILNPIGDLETMARLLSIVKPGGYVGIGFPCCHDRLDWNAHRIYGPIRLQKLFAGYEILGVYPQDSRMGLNTGNGFQPIWLLKNQLACQRDMNVSSVISGVDDLENMPQDMSKNYT